MDLWFRKTVSVVDINAFPPCRCYEGTTCILCREDLAAFMLCWLCLLHLGPGFSHRGYFQGCGIGLVTMEKREREKGLTVQESRKSQ